MPKEFESVANSSSGASSSSFADSWQSIPFGAGPLPPPGKPPLDLAVDARFEALQARVAELEKRPGDKHIV